MDVINLPEKHDEQNGLALRPVVQAELDQVAGGSSSDIGVKMQFVLTEANILTR